MNNLDKSKKIIIAIAIVLFIIGGYFIYNKDPETLEITNDEETFENKKKNEEISDTIKIHITGAIVKEGIITLDENSRVADAVEAAGGLKEDADMSKINLAYVLQDGMKLKIPSINDKTNTEENDNELTFEEEDVESIIKNESKSETTKVNINKASQTELETLPGIGPSLALDIINYRKENGKFDNVDDIKQVSGIGNSKFEKIKELICVK